MRYLFNILVTAVTAASALTACTKLTNFQCQQDSSCNLSGGGVCAAAPTGNSWCAYPDPGCPNGYRYSTVGVGDGVSGGCVPEPNAKIDAGLDAGPPPPASCIALPHTCGVAGNDNCCNSPVVSGGRYFRSYDVVNDSLSGDMNSPATISSFRLDKYEVTVGRLRAFVADGQGTQAKHPATGAGAHVNIPGSGWEESWNANLSADTATLVSNVECDPEANTVQTWTDVPGSNENRPINCVTWYEAMAFCAWDGGFLPSEAEWDYAAAGGDQQRAYPWSTPQDPLEIDVSRASYAIYDNASLMFQCLANGMPDCSITDIVPVGTLSAGDGRWGQSDLGGNMMEWTLDWYAAYRVPCEDCANLSVSSHRVFRGGSYHGDKTDIRETLRPSDLPIYRRADVGFRCARSSP